MKTTHTLGILFLLAPLIAIADPAARVQKMSDRVIFRNNTFYPKTEFSGKNFALGQWQTALANTQNPWVLGGAITSPPGTPAFFNELQQKIPNSTAVYGGLPGVRMDTLLSTAQNKAQFLEDWRTGKANIALGVAQGQAVPLDTLCSVLNADPAYAKELYIATINTIDVGIKKSSNPITSAILCAGTAAAPSRQTLASIPPMDLTGTGITEEKFLMAVGVTSPYSSADYKSKVIFDE